MNGYPDGDVVYRVLTYELSTLSVVIEKNSAAGILHLI